MKKTKFKTGEQVKTVKTDGLQGYPAVLKKPSVYNLLIMLLQEQKAR